MTTARGPVPWLTAALVTAAVLLALWPAGQTLAVFERAAILRGEVWRLATGHLVHFNGVHLAWNLAVVLLAGVMAERARPVATRWFLLTAPAVLGLALLGIESDLEHYAGLSGIATGLVVLVGLHWLGGAARDRWSGVAVLVLVALKITGEWTGRTPAFVDLTAEHIRIVPLVHLAGAVWAVLVLAVSTRVLSR